MTAEDKNLSVTPDADPMRANAMFCTPVTLAERYQAVRDETEFLAARLSAEDQSIQSMPDASPAKLHRAHVTWFFETVILERFLAEYEVFDPAHAYLFNSYYESLGDRHPRATRGQISRPNLRDVALYRAHVDRAMQKLLTRTHLPETPTIRNLVELGRHRDMRQRCGSWRSTAARP